MNTYLALSLLTAVVPLAVAAVGYLVAQAILCRRSRHLFVAQTPKLKKEATP